MRGLRGPLAPLHRAGVELGAAVIGAGYPLAVEAGRLRGARDLSRLVCQDAAGYLADDVGGYLVYLHMVNLLRRGQPDVPVAVARALLGLAVLPCAYRLATVPLLGSVRIRSTA